MKLDYLKLLELFRAQLIDDQLHLTYDELEYFKARVKAAADEFKDYEEAEEYLWEVYDEILDKSLIGEVA